MRSVPQRALEFSEVNRLSNNQSISKTERPDTNYFINLLRNRLSNGSVEKVIRHLVSPLVSTPVSQ